METAHELFLQTFFAEAEEQLQKLSETLVVLETTPDDEALLQEIFRVAHTLKGNASCFDLPDVVRLANSLEDTLEKLRRKVIPVSTEVISMLLQGVDALSQLLPAAIEGSDVSSPYAEELQEQLLQFGPKEEPSDSPTPSQSPVYRKPTLRVELEKLDRMLTLAGEIAISRGRVSEMLENVDWEREKFAEVHRESERVYSELQELTTQIRMVPLGPMFRQYRRVVRDLAAEHGKLARVRIEGEEVEADAALLESLRAPLIHLLRNALAHGIEAPTERTAKGKEPYGCVSLAAFREASSLVIKISDDGAGFQTEQIRERAIALGLLSEGDKTPEQELYQQVFSPGFSTAPSVSALSGRGVGMDVVRKNIEQLRGSIRIESEHDRGATVTLRLPLTVSVLDGFSVGVGDETYVIPVASITECLAVPEEERGKSGAGVIQLRGRVVPYIRLKDVFRIKKTRASKTKESIIVVEDDGNQIGVAVDYLYGSSQVVMKPLARAFHYVPGIAGSVILGSGRVAMVLDIPSLLRTFKVRRNSFE